MNNVERDLIIKVLDAYYTCNVEYAETDEAKELFESVKNLHDKMVSTDQEERVVEALDTIKTGMYELGDVWGRNLGPDDRINKALCELYPFSISYFEQLEDVDKWVDVSSILLENDEDTFTLDKHIELLLKYNWSQHWVDKNTSGGIKMFFKEYTTIRKGSHVLVTLNDESIGLYRCTMQEYDEDPDLDLCDRFITQVETEYKPNDTVFLDLSHLESWLATEDIDDIRIGQWIYINRYCSK